MHYDITPDTVAQVIYQKAICPTGVPQDAVKEWMDIPVLFEKSVYFTSVTCG